VLSPYLVKLDTFEMTHSIGLSAKAMDDDRLKVFNRLIIGEFTKAQIFPQYESAKKGTT